MFPALVLARVALPFGLTIETEVSFPVWLSVLSVSLVEVVLLTTGLTLLLLIPAAARGNNQARSAHC